MVIIDSEFYMRLAIKEAWRYQGLTYPNPAVGCSVVAEDGEILAVEAHQKSGKSHAEVLALKSAYYKLTDNSEILQLNESADIHSYLIKNHNNIFKTVTIYTTLEPCSHVGKTPSCANLLSLLGVKKIYVGSLDFNEEASNGNKKLFDSGIEVESGVLKKECDNLLIPFKSWRDDNFVFFKWAQRLNGTYDGGSISSLESRKNVHAMRDVCDLLVIGGNTVRTDRPTLDARLVDGKAPDVLIISQQKEFDHSIPLFNVEGRDVFIEDNFSKLIEYKNIMIEGGANMFELSRDYIDMYLCYIAPNIGGTLVFDKIDDNFEILNIQKETQDIIMWMKRIDSNE